MVTRLTLLSILFFAVVGQKIDDVSTLRVASCFILGKSQSDIDTPELTQIAEQYELDL